MAEDRCGSISRNDDDDVISRFYSDIGDTGGGEGRAGQILLLFFNSAGLVPVLLCRAEGVFGEEYSVAPGGGNKNPLLPLGER